MPTPTTYTYSLSLDAPGGTINPDKLAAAIRTSSIITALAEVATDAEADTFSITFRDQLSSGDRTTLDGGTGSGGTGGSPSSTHPAGGLIASTDNTPNPPETQPVHVVGDTTGDAFDDKMTAVGGVGTGDFAPTSNRAPRVVDRNQKAPLNLDSEGQLMNRGPTLTDEGSFRDDFPGSSLTWAVTGTVTITPGSAEIVGAGTNFLDELDRNTYVRVVGDGEANWTLVGRVISNGTFELDEHYSGSTGAGKLIEATYWPTKTGSGGSITVSDGKVRLDSGTTSGSKTRIWREADYLPMAMTVCVDVSQRVDETRVVAGWRDDPDSPHSQAVLVLDGSDQTKFKMLSSCGPGDSELQEATFGLPRGMRTDIPIIFQLALTTQGFLVTVLTKDEAFPYPPSRLHIPGPYDDMRVVLEVENVDAPSDATVLSVDVLVLENHNTVAIGQPNRAHCVPVVVRDEVKTRVQQSRGTSGHYKPLPVVFAVPSGKVRYKDVTVPGLSAGIDWMDLDFLAADVTSGDKIVMGKGFMGVVGQVAANAAQGATSVLVASTPGVLAPTSRGGVLDEGFFLSFGAESTTDSDLNTAADAADPGDDRNPAAELPEYMVLRLSDQDENGVAQIQLAQPLADAITAGAFVNLIVRVVDEPVEITKGKHYHFGAQALEAGSLPAGAKLRFGFRNESDHDETVRAELHTLY